MVSVLLMSLLVLYTYADKIIVDKIIIAQESLQEFINMLSPGAYSSITKVNFKILDDLVIKPFGIYGSKEEIVRFLREIHAVDDIAFVLLFSVNRANATEIVRINYLRVRMEIRLEFLNQPRDRDCILFAHSCLLPKSKPMWYIGPKRQLGTTMRLRLSSVTE